MAIFHNQETNVIITPLENTPNAITIIEGINLSRSVAAIKEPVHAPVPGIGIATKRNIPHSSYFPILAAFSSAFFMVFIQKFCIENCLDFFLILKLITNLPTASEVESHSKILFAKIIKNGTGTKLPITATAYVI